ncbi:MAG: MerR family transcriptional regulator [Proteobacteria bacterium]|nr:MAG: MerR family transcriptional regulator [Pseudomonadota bacterium]
MSRDPVAGRYRIQAVVEMTGVPAATLRAWERRYGLPKPQRSRSSYRLYSDHDIEVIRRLRDHCARGMAPSEAARLVARMAVEADETPSLVEAGADIYDEAQTWALDAIERGDIAELRTICERALGVGSALQLLDRLIVPVLHEMGARWYRGELSIAAEHLASEQLGTLIRELARLLAPLAPRGKALLACVSWETHILPLYVVAAQWSQWGLQPIVLGARLPIEDLADAVERIDPLVIGLSVSVDPPRQTRISEVWGDYARVCAGRQWVVGGAQAAAHHQRIRALGGHVAPAEIAAHRGLIERILNTPLVGASDQLVGASDERQPA